MVLILTLSLSATLFIARVIFPTSKWKTKGRVRPGCLSVWSASGLVPEPCRAVELCTVAGPWAQTAEKISYSSCSISGGGLTASKTSRSICDSICTTHGFPFCLWTFASCVAIWKESSFMIRDRFGSEKKCNSIKYYLLAGSTIFTKSMFLGNINGTANKFSHWKHNCHQKCQLWSLNVSPLWKNFLLKIIFKGLQVHIISSSWLTIFTNIYCL